MSGIHGSSFTSVKAGASVLSRNGGQSDQDVLLRFIFRRSVFMLVELQRDFTRAEQPQWVVLC